MKPKNWQDSNGRVCGSPGCFNPSTGRRCSDCVREYNNVSRMYRDRTKRGRKRPAFVVCRSPGCFTKIHIKGTGKAPERCKPCKTLKNTIKNLWNRRTDPKFLEQRRAWYKSHYSIEENRLGLRKLNNRWRAEQRIKGTTYAERQRELVRKRAPVFVRCPAGSVFDTWLDWIVAKPSNPFPDLCREPGTWRPLVVPDYLKAVP